MLIRIFWHGRLKRACRAESANCIANGGRPSSDEPRQWRAGSDKNRGDEEISKNLDRSEQSHGRPIRAAGPAVVRS